MNILITGYKGFIGQSLCRYLSKKGIPWDKFDGDITNIKTFTKKSFDIIIHLAALIPHKNCWTDKKLYNVNVTGTLNLYRYYQKTKFIYISTIDVHEQPLTIYAQSKLKAEAIIRKKRKNLIIRLPSIFGPNQKQDKLIPRLFKHYYLKQSCTIYNNDVREYLFIDEVSKQIVDNLHKSGIIILQGIKIRNKRLKELIKAIYFKHNIPAIKKDEQKLFKQLKICSKTYEYKAQK